MEIISGLHSSSVYRLKQTWAVSILLLSPFFLFSTFFSGSFPLSIPFFFFVTLPPLLHFFLLRHMWFEIGKLPFQLC